MATWKVVTVDDDVGLFLVARSCSSCWWNNNPNRRVCAKYSAYKLIRKRISLNELGLIRAESRDYWQPDRQYGLYLSLWSVLFRAVGGRGPLNECGLSAFINQAQRWRCMVCSARCTRAPIYDGIVFLTQTPGCCVVEMNVYEWLAMVLPLSETRCNRHKGARVTVSVVGAALKSGPSRPSLGRSGGLPHPLRALRALPQATPVSLSLH